MNCSVSIEKSQDVPNISWIVNGRAGITEHESVMNGKGNFSKSLLFSPLRTSHAGRYECVVDIMVVNDMKVFHMSVNRECKLLSVRNANTHKNFFYCTVPPPTAVTIRKTVGTIFAESSLTLICTVELNPGVDTEVMVNAVWITPNERREQELPSDPVNTNTYENTAVFSSVQVSDSGEYTCIAIITSSLEFITGNPTLSGRKNITVGRM